MYVPYCPDPPSEEDMQGMVEASKKKIPKFWSSLRFYGKDESSNANFSLVVGCRVSINFSLFLLPADC